MRVMVFGTSVKSVTLHFGQAVTELLGHISRTHQGDVGHKELLNALGIHRVPYGKT